MATIVFSSYAALENTYARHFNGSTHYIDILRRGVEKGLIAVREAMHKDGLLVREPTPEEVASFDALSRVIREAKARSEAVLMGTQDPDISKAASREYSILDRWDGLLLAFKRDHREAFVTPLERNMRPVLDAIHAPSRSEALWDEAEKADLDGLPVRWNSDFRGSADSIFSFVYVACSGKMVALPTFADLSGPDVAAQFWSRIAAEGLITRNSLQNGMDPADFPSHDVGHAGGYLGHLGTVEEFLAGDAPMVWLGLPRYLRRMSPLQAEAFYERVHESTEPDLPEFDPVDLRASDDMGLTHRVDEAGSEGIDAPGE
jgi:hypothetical protein